MLSFYLTDREGRERPLDSVLTAVLDGDIGVPADSLTVTCPFDGGVRENADRIRACDGERVVGFRARQGCPHAAQRRGCSTERRSP